MDQGEETISVEKVKEAFKAGATPSDTDYSKLIDLATVGCKAVGASTEDVTTVNPGVGLAVVQGALTVKQGVGVSVGSDGVAISYDKDHLEITEKKELGIKLKEKGGLSKDGGLHVAAGAGLTVDKGNGLELNLAEKSGLTTASSKLGVAVDENRSGLEFDGSNGLRVKLQPENESYIERGAQGLAITGAGIERVKGALKDASINALGKAVTNTSSGFKEDESVGKEPVEQAIAKALNEAYAGGWNLKQAYVELKRILYDLRTSQEKFFVKDSVISLSSEATYLDFYSRNAEGSDGKYKYGDGCLAAAMVGANGVASWVDVGGNVTNFERGVYAIVGRIDKDGIPAKDGGYYTQHALMVVAADNADMPTKKIGAVLGHWDFLATNDQWKDADESAWSSHPTFDPIVECVAYKEGYQNGFHDQDISLIRPEVTSFRLPADTVGGIDLKMHADVRHTGDDDVYFVPVVDSKGTWGAVVKDLTKEGVLTLKNLSAGNISVLAVEVAEDVKDTGWSKIDIELYKASPKDRIKEKVDGVAVPLEGWDIAHVVDSYSGRPISATIKSSSKELGAKVEGGKLFTEAGKVGSVTLEVTIQGDDYYDVLIGESTINIVKYYAEVQFCGRKYVGKIESGIGEVDVDVVVDYGALVSLTYSQYIGGWYRYTFCDNKFFLLLNGDLVKPSDRVKVCAEKEMIYGGEPNPVEIWWEGAYLHWSWEALNHYYDEDGIPFSPMKEAGQRLKVSIALEDGIKLNVCLTSQ
ncbi:hypothetical protein U6010_11060 [Pseudomonas aeruginosa]|uniref:hypothetical protein n=1 Tax=Pseudomonas aeruginosa TaxID=287 RepID=UPI002ADD8573|nr:hypothetical protein [Pseudomonas aeruginosa]MEA0988980.1 hypothetical protein [Pseudomonas aeruginosa]